MAVYPVLVVGVGDDGPAGLPPAVLARVMSADVLVGGRRHLELFEDTAGERVTIAGGLDPVFDAVESSARTGQVVVLASGDPCFFGIGPLLAARLGRDAVEIVPHVSSVALAFARLGVSWHDARVVSAHGRDLDAAIQAAHGAEKLAVLTDDTNTPGVIAGALLAAGACDADACVFEHLGGSREQSHRARLSSLSTRTFAALNVLVVPALSWGAVEEGERALRVAGFGLPETEYAHAAGMITKPEIRVVVLSKLRLPTGGVLWDVGSGSGSVAIEAANLVPGLTAFAVERSDRQLALLSENVQRHDVAGAVQVVAGEAPDVLASLPQPDAVFVGGSGGQLLEILSYVRSRIRPDGRIVVNLVTYEHVGEALAWARSHKLETEVVQVSVARGADILGLTRLQAENPVTIVTVHA
ncbi:MAG: precorrin-6y C5,15-methyltransferase (decarboxylating) subunit CbiE [Chloroflexota bacterium]